MDREGESLWTRLKLSLAGDIAAIKSGAPALVPIFEHFGVVYRVPGFGLGLALLLLLAAVGLVALVMLAIAGWFWLASSS